MSIESIGDRAEKPRKAGLDKQTERTPAAETGRALREDEAENSSKRKTQGRNKTRKGEDERKGWRGPEEIRDEIEVFGGDEVEGIEKESNVQEKVWKVPCQLLGRLTSFGLE